MKYEEVYPDLKCEFCGKVGGNVIVYRQRTLYPEPEKNFTAACPDCKEYNDEYWDEMWAEHYQSMI